MQSKWHGNLLIGFFSAVCVVNIALAQDSAADREFTFAARLLERGEHKLAVEAFEQFISKFSADQRVADAHYYLAVLNRREFRDDAPRQITAQLAHLEGVLAARAGDHDGASDRLGVALAAARSLAYHPWVAEILVDYAASLAADGRAVEAAPLLDEARAIAEPLGWSRLLGLIDGLGAVRLEEAATS